MYTTFFNLNHYPFEPTPDPAYFVASKRHNEALSALYYGVRRHRGFVVLTGEVGTGKTMLLRCLLGLLTESPDVTYAYVFNGRLSDTEFLQYILTEFGLPAAGRSKYELLLDLAHFLVSRCEKKMTTVLIIDEAHHLSAELLEEIRLLSNLETTNDKLLQIVLAGQPELDVKLESVELRQLKQRIAVRARLGALNIDETRDYIKQRLQIAGADAQRKPLFPQETIAAVHRYSQGLPRLISTICESGLISAYARQMPWVTAEMIEDVSSEFRLELSAAHATEQAVRQRELNVRRVI